MVCASSIIGEGGFKFLCISPVVELATQLVLCFLSCASNLKCFSFLFWNFSYFWNYGNIVPKTIVDFTKIWDAFLTL